MHSPFKRLVAAAITVASTLTLASGAHAAGWQQIGQLSNSADNGRDPITASAPDGSAWTVWFADNKLQIQRVAADGTKGPVKDIDTNFAENTALVPESNGNALVAWSVSSSGVFVREVHPDGTLGTTEPVGDSSASGPVALGIDGSDVATIGYTEPDTTNTSNFMLWADRVTHGVPSGSPIQVSTNNHETVETMSMAENAAGDAVFSWGFSNFTDFTFPGPVWGRHIRRLNSGGTLGTEHDLGDMQFSSDTFTAPIIQPGGDAYVAYDQISTSGGQQGDMKVAKLDAADNLLPVATLDDEAESFAPAESIVSNSAGDLTVVWQTSDPNTFNLELVSRRIHPDGSVAPPLASAPDGLAVAGDGFEGEWALVALPDGKAAAVWSNGVTSPTVFQSSIIDPTSGPAAPATITTTTDGNEALSAAPDSAGDIFLAFDHTPDFSSYAVDGAYYDVQGPTVGTFAVPTDGTAGDAMVFGASAADRSGIKTTSWDFGDGEHADGAIASHAYSAPGTYTVTATVTDEADNTTTESQQVTVRSVSSGGASGGNGPVQPGSLKARLAGFHASAHLGRGRILLLHLPAQPVDAFGSLLVRANAGHAARLVTLGSRQFPVFHGKPVRLRLKLSAKTLKLARRHHRRLKASVRLLLTGFDGKSAGHTYHVTIRTGR